MTSRGARESVLVLMAPLERLSGPHYLSPLSPLLPLSISLQIFPLLLLVLSFCSLLPAFLCFTSHLLAFLPDPLPPSPFLLFPPGPHFRLSSFPFPLSRFLLCPASLPTHTLHVSLRIFDIRCKASVWRVATPCPAQGCEG